MPVFLKENLATLLVGLAVLAVLALSLAHIVREKKRAKAHGGCAGGCCGCPCAGKCRKEI